MSELRWTKTLPTKPGLWLMRYAGKADTLQAYRVTGNCWPSTLPEHSEWAGPIPEPQEPEPPQHPLLAAIETTLQRVIRDVHRGEGRVSCGELRQEIERLLSLGVELVAREAALRAMLADCVKQVTNFDLARAARKLLEAEHGPDS